MRKNRVFQIMRQVRYGSLIGCVMKSVHDFTQLITILFERLCTVGRAVTWRRGFVNNYLGVILACLGNRTACNATEELSEKIFHKTSSTSKSPSWYTVVCIKISFKSP